MEIATKKLTWEEFRELEIPEGDTSIYELIKGEIVRRASPNTPHQRTLRRILNNMENFMLKKQSGELFCAPYDVYLDDENAGIQPDILYVSKERDFIIRENNGIVGTPDLLVEILSKGTMGRDLGDKKDLYERFAVKEYWIVNPAARSIEIYKMENNRYRLLSAAAEDGTVESAVLQGFVLDLADVF